MEFISNLLCRLGLHYWVRSRRGNKFRCGRTWHCKAERAWRKGDN